jgi:hypothetical protein
VDPFVELSIGLKLKPQGERKAHHKLPVGRKWQNVFQQIQAHLKVCSLPDQEDQANPRGSGVHGGGAVVGRRHPPPLSPRGSGGGVTPAGGLGAEPPENKKLSQTLKPREPGELQIFRLPLMKQLDKIWGQKYPPKPLRDIQTVSIYL